MRQAQVQSVFLQSFGTLFPQLTFRGIRRFASRSFGPFSFALRVAIGRANTELDLFCVTLTDGHPREVERFTERIRGSEETDTPNAAAVLVAPFFSEEARALCRQQGVGYFDLAGNAGLDTEHIFVDISGRQNKQVRKRSIEEPFEGKAERVTRRLLLEPQRHWTMRDLAEAADVSLGMASMVTTSLAEEGLVSKGRAGLELFDPLGLLEQWAESYDLRRSVFRIYRSPLEVFELEGRISAQREALNGRYALTLWSAASRALGGSGSPSHLALFWTDRLDLLADSLGLSTTTGKTVVFVFQPYDDSLLWGAGPGPDGLTIVNPLQLYLDLGSGDEQEMALAQRVRECLLPW